MPRDVQGRQFYMCSPEYMSKFAKRFIQAGAKFIGGCCGTTPSHIKFISDAVRAASPRAQRVFVSGSLPLIVDEKPAPDAQVMRRAGTPPMPPKISRGD